MVLVLPLLGNGETGHSAGWSTLVTSGRWGLRQQRGRVMSVGLLETPKHRLDHIRSGEARSEEAELAVHSRAQRVVLLLGVVVSCHALGESGVGAAASARGLREERQGAGDAAGVRVRRSRRPVGVSRSCEHSRDEGRSCGPKTTVFRNGASGCIAYLHRVERGQSGLRREVTLSGPLPQISAMQGGSGTWSWTLSRLHFGPLPTTMGVAAPAALLPESP